MKQAMDAYVQQLEARVRFYMKRMEADHKPNYAAAIALSRVIGDFTGENRWDAFERIQQARLRKQGAGTVSVDFIS